MLIGSWWRETSIFKSEIQNEKELLGEQTNKIDWIHSFGRTFAKYRTSMEKPVLICDADREESGSRNVNVKMVTKMGQHHISLILLSCDLSISFPLQSLSVCLCVWPIHFLSLSVSLPFSSSTSVSQYFFLSLYVYVYVCRCQLSSSLVLTCSLTGSTYGPKVVKFFSIARPATFTISKQQEWSWVERERKGKEKRTMGPIRDKGRVDTVAVWEREQVKWWESLRRW